MNNKRVYDWVREFKNKYPMTVAWRLDKNSKVIEKHLGLDEEILYAFPGQKNSNSLDIITTCVVAITNKRILIGSKRVVFGYFLTSITPDLFNDFKVYSGIIWGKVIIDTVKELVYISNLDKKSLSEIETTVTGCILDLKRKYNVSNQNKSE